MKTQTEMRVMRLPAGCGKTIFEVERVQALLDNPNPSLKEDEKRAIYMSMREEVEGLDFGRFLTKFGPTTDEETLSFMGRIQFSLHGYEDDPRELYEIPEVRKFYGELNRIWPCWFYYADTQNPDCLRTLLCCLLDGITIVSKKRSKRVEVRISH